MDKIITDSPEDDTNNNPPDDSEKKSEKDSENNSDNDAVKNTARIKDLLSQVNRLNFQIDKLNTEKVLLGHDYSQMEFEISKLRRTNSRSKTEISQLQDENTRLKSEISQLHEENSRLKSEYSELQKDIDRMELRYSELTDTTPLVVAEITDTLPNNEVCLRSFDYPGKYIIKAPSEMAGILKTGMTVAARMEGAGTPGAIVKIMNNTFDSRVRLMELEESPKVTFEDIGGLKDVIEEVREAVEYPLTKPEAFEKMGVEPPKGVLLCGPPGTGKTLIARAVANQAKATFIRLSGSDLIQRYMGESVHMVRELFELAREKSPSIIFIDEIDAIGTQRSSDPLSSTQVAHAEILMQLLSEMDGFDNRGNVRIMAATNRVDMLDNALLRPGRFDRILKVPYPDAGSRREILKIHSAKLPLAADVDTETVVGMTKGCTGAEIQAICQEAGMFAIRRNNDSVTGNDFSDAVAKVRNKGRNAKSMNFDNRVRVMELEDTPKVTLAQIGGLKDVIEEVREAVEYPLTKPGVFEKIGVEPPKGVLLCGPPGTGKTLIAKAIANQAKATFIRLSGPELNQKYMGEGARLVRELFDLAREKSPSIIFIDEIDAFGTARTSDDSSGRGTADILIQLLTEMDGFDKRGNVRIMAATNRVDMLDQALLRPGRFDRILEIPLPDADSRREILRIHSGKLSIAADIDIDTVLKMTEGCTGADIEAICREAGMFAIRRNSESVTQNDFTDAVAKVRKTGKPVKSEDVMYT